ncbi:YCII-related domain-containing protein [Dissoconium aciculare CBS 342.82]|jgi:uncharacterized protein YciI|uniref:YCII-related domain-containing protein n=1 Tax=Dissoconium aciculare CBS 342.82 TaxID=1314786 RepID=A0A6J3M3K7_9PEZI|nr:YCII-related domain-containing protein [Dissoconium aciculare CBS 342.82]KAF1821512.1 YCII-related domain-containing protein [Dissoconium aciculare CBS 342.82]
MAATYDWLVRTPANEADGETRRNVRPEHLIHNKPLIENGTLLFGGPSLSRHPNEGETDLAVNGSIQLIRAESEAAVREIVRNDPYSKAGFWRAEEAVILPFRCVLRTPA